MKTMIALVTGVLLVAATPSLSFTAAQKKGPAVTTGQSTQQGPKARDRGSCIDYVMNVLHFRGQAIRAAVARCRAGENQ